MEEDADEWALQQMIILGVNLNEAARLYENQWAEFQSFDRAYIEGRETHPHPLSRRDRILEAAKHLEIINEFGVRI